MTSDVELSTEAGKFSYGFFKAFISEKQEQIVNFFSKNKVGFLPKGCTYINIKKAQTRQSFKQLKYLIGSHQMLPIVSIGLWLNSLPEDEQRKIVEEIKNDIFQKYQRRGVNILNLAATGFIEGFIKFLTNYNLEKNLSKKELVDIFERALDDWEQITIFVKKDNVVETTTEKIKNRLLLGGIRIESGKIRAQRFEASVHF